MLTNPRQLRESVPHRLDPRHSTAACQASDVKPTGGRHRYRHEMMELVPSSLIPVAAAGLMCRPDHGEARRRMLVDVTRYMQAWVGVAIVNSRPWGNDTLEIMPASSLSRNAMGL